MRFFPFLWHFREESSSILRVECWKTGEVSISDAGEALPRRWLNRTRARWFQSAERKGKYPGRRSMGAWRAALSPRKATERIRETILRIDFSRVFVETTIEIRMVNTVWISFAGNIVRWSLRGADRCRFFHDADPTGSRNGKERSNRVRIFVDVRLVSAIDMFFSVIHLYLERAYDCITRYDCITVESQPSTFE